MTKVCEIFVVYLGHFSATKLFYNQYKGNHLNKTKDQAGEVEQVEEPPIGHHSMITRFLVIKPDN